jgi:hypothetical protein
VNHSGLVEVSLGNFREQRDDAARWLAVEAQTRVRYGVA